MSTLNERTDYAEILRTLGYFIQQQHISEVSIVEFDRGWIISGLTYKATAQGFIRIPTDYVLSHDELRTLMSHLRSQRQHSQSRRGWLR